MRLLRAAGRMLFRGPAARRQTIYRARLRLRGIDLRGATVGELGLDQRKCHEYVDSGYLVDRVFRKISGGRSVLDIGCGKGGAMLALLLHFDRVDGIEIAEPLVRVARVNLRNYANRVRVFHGDATRFPRFQDYDTFYLYNPFPEIVLRAVMERILAVNPTARIVYVRPKFAAVLEDMGYEETMRVDCSHPVAVYQLSAASAERRRPKVVV